MVKVNSANLVVIVSGIIVNAFICITAGSINSIFVFRSEERRVGKECM